MQSHNETIQGKWQPVLEHPDLPEIGDVHKKAVVAQLLENTETALRESGSWNPGAGLLAEAAPLNSMGASSSTAGDGNVDIYDPVLISLVRRAMPNLVAYDVCGVKPTLHLLLTKTLITMVMMSVVATVERFQ